MGGENSPSSLPVESWDNTIAIVILVGFVATHFQQLPDLHHW
ncbi:hypothetical protein [Chamaesiphon polymorphus]|nr:hypothetical protein [Chamaesiphon polymorphus]